MPLETRRGACRDDNKSDLGCVGARGGGVRAEPVDGGAGRRGRLEPCQRRIALPASYVGEFGDAALVRPRAAPSKDLFDDHRRDPGVAPRLLRHEHLHRRSVLALRLQHRLVPQGLCRRRRPVRRQAQGRGLPAVHRSLFGDAERPARAARWSMAASMPASSSSAARISTSAHSSATTSCATTSPPSAARQIAANPDICGAAASRTSSAVISQTNNWHSLRVGLEGVGGVRPALEAHRRRRLAALCAALRRRLALLRIGTNPGDFTGPIPEDGKGWGYQIDAIVSYHVNDWLSIGAGGRYWHVRGQGPHPFRGPCRRLQRRCRRSCTGRPIISAASSRPASSSVPIRARSATNLTGGQFAPDACDPALRRHASSVMESTIGTTMDRLLRATINTWNGLKSAIAQRGRVPAGDRRSPGRDPARLRGRADRLDAAPADRRGRLRDGGGTAQHRDREARRPGHPRDRPADRHASRTSARPRSGCRCSSPARCGSRARGAARAGCSRPIARSRASRHATSSP